MAARQPVLTTCQTAFGEGIVPYDCPSPEFDHTTNPLTQIPLESCPEPCQTYFIGILDTCSVDDPLGRISWRYPPTYAQYTVWDQFHSLYPACNLGPTPPACHRAWNRGRVPSDCRSLASFNFTSHERNPLESCPEPCQTHFTEILESCSVGDTHQFRVPCPPHFTSCEPINLWDRFHDQYPMCNLGEPVPGEDSTVTGPGEDSTPSAGSNPVPEAGPQQSESVRTVSGHGLFLLCITMVRAVAEVQCGS